MEAESGSPEAVAGITPATGVLEVEEEWVSPEVQAARDGQRVDMSKVVPENEPEEA